MHLKSFIFCCIMQSIACAKVPQVEVGYPPLVGSASPRIVGGVDATESQAPFQCSLQMHSEHFCGCAIISSKWILTAAHCVGKRPVEKIRIVVGTNQWNSGGVHYEAQKTIINENFDSPPFANDIGLIQVKGEIEFNEKVQPIKYSSKEVPAGSSVQATGWGRLSAGDQLPINLQVINSTTISYDECHNRILEVHKSHLCTVSDVGQGVCNGDSGGPLVFENELVGLVNFVVPCGRGFPDGFANIAYFYDWIQGKIGAQVVKS